MIRKIFFTLASLIALTVAAQTSSEEYFHVPNVKLDENGKGTVEVWLNTPNDDVTEFQMEIYLPEGFTITKNRAGNYDFKFNTEDDITYDHAMSSAYHANGNFYRILGATMSQTAFLPGDHKFFSFTIVAPEGFEKEAEASLRNILIARDNETYRGPIYFEINPYNSMTGVDGVTVAGDDGEETIFDLLGRKVSRPLAPGYYIINGEKLLVK